MSQCTSEKMRRLLAELYLDVTEEAERLLGFWRANGVADVISIEHQMRKDAKTLKGERERALAEKSGSETVLCNPLNQAMTVDRIAAAAKTVLAGHVFARDGRLMRLHVTHEKKIKGGAIIDPGKCRIVEVKPNWLNVEMQQRGVSYLRMSDEGAYAVPPPWEDLRAFCEIGERYKFPPLRGLTAVPTLARSEPGYDPASELFLAFPRGMFPAAPEWPKRKDAEEAFARVVAPIREYRFEDEVSRAVAIAALMAGVLRWEMAHCPLHAFNAKHAGSGKSMLANTAGFAACGAMPALLALSKSSEENEKRLTTMLMQSKPAISLDNLEYGLSGIFLCMMLTENPLETRRLGSHDSVTLDTTVALTATGVDLEILGDMRRRCVVCTIVKGPKKRRHSFNPVNEMKRVRSQYVVDVLTVARAWIAEGRPMPVGYRSMDSFEAYDVIRGPLLWLGEADPALSQAELLADDEGITSRAAEFEKLHSEVGEREFGVDAFAGDAADLKAFLQCNSDRIGGDLYLEPVGRDRWRFRVVEDCTEAYSF